MITGSPKALKVSDAPRAQWRRSPINDQKIKIAEQCMILAPRLHACCHRQRGHIARSCSASCGLTCFQLHHRNNRANR